MVPASPGPEQIDNPHWDDPMTIPGQGKQVTGEVTLKGMEKTLDSALQASPVLAETATQVSEEESSDITKSILTNSRTHSAISHPFLRLSLLSCLRRHRPQILAGSRRRVRHASLSLSESGSVRRTRSMTATAMSASASPTRIPGPSEVEEPESWESACQADKRMSHMINAGKAARSIFIASLGTLRIPNEHANETFNPKPGL